MSAGEHHRRDPAGWNPLAAVGELSVLDEHIAERPGGPNTGKLERAKRLRHGLPNVKLVRYADDWCLMVRGTKADAEALREDIAAVLATMGLRLSPDKTLITHIDEGLDFLGWRIQRHHKRGTSKHYVYVYPSKKAVLAAKRKIKTLCRRIEIGQPLDDLLRRVNATVRGWAATSGPGCPRRCSPISATTCGRRCGDGSAANTRNRPGSGSAIPSPWPDTTTEETRAA